jgi:two-component system KDP operon response regulator KdpE
MKKLRVLVVDDDVQTARSVGASLRACGYEIMTAEDGCEGLKMAGEAVFDLVILSLTLPGISGFDMCTAIRKHSDVPIIAFSARGRQRDIVRALDLGADDCLTKPFSMEELLARIRAVLRRTIHSARLPRPPLVIGDLSIDFAAQRVLVRGKHVQLTQTEYEIVAHLALHSGRVLTHRALLQAVWGPAYGDENEYLWTYIRRLRHKLEPNPRQPRYLLTQPGVGYYLAADDE